MANINEAIAQANRFDRALKMQSEGYKASTVYTDRLSFWEVYKPGNDTGMWDYTADMANRTCTCEDFKKNRRDCKHLLFVDITLDEQARMEAQAAEHDALQASAE